MPLTSGPAIAATSPWSGGEPRLARAWPLLGWALALAWWLLPLDSRVARPWDDHQRQWLAADTPPAGVKVVDIDEASLTDLQPLIGTWPIGRDVHAAIIHWLREQGARAVVIDLLLADPLRGDAVLAAELAAPGAPVVLAAAGHQPASGRFGGSPPEVSAGVYPWPALTLPTPTLATLGRPQAVGVITTPLDDDGVLRRLPLWHRAPGLTAPLPAMPLAVWQAVHANPGLPAGIAVDSESAVALALGQAGAAPKVLPFAALARAALGADSSPAWAAEVAGQVVFIGSSAMLADRIMTPAGQRDGTALLAEAYAALRDGQVLPARQRGWELLLLAIAALPAIMAARRGQASLRRDAAATSLALAAIAAMTVALLLGLRLTLPTLAPLLALALALLGSIAWRQFALQSRARQLAYESAVASAAERAKSEFLANVSHEVRTPLNGLLGVAELLALSPLNEEQRRHVQIFRDSGQTLKALIDDLLDLTKIEAGGFELHPAPFALRPLLDQVQRLMLPRAEAKGLALDVSVDAALPVALFGDRQRLEQVLLNLVGNAIKFTAQGRVEIAVSAGTPQALLLAVSDTGIGIAASKHARVFEPFAQADGSITRQYGGTGLGLAIVRRLVQLMGGQITLASHPGEGSRFTVTLPLVAADLPSAAAEVAAAAAAESGAAAGASAAAARPYRVLLAEDNEVNVYIFTAMLRPPEYEVVVADNGRVALEFAQTRSFDIGFIDLMMPAMDGMTMARELRAWEAARQRERLPLVALTARAFDSDVAACLAAGFDRHLGKPFEREQLLLTINRHARPHDTTDPVPPGLPPMPALRPSASPERLAHARLFIGHFEEEHAAALRLGDAAQARDLLRDLAQVADSVGAQALAAQARSAGALQPLAEALRSSLGQALVALATLPAAGERPPDRRG
jgi:signal transduction histidine kinase/CheY-like chemotaxis protein